MTLSPAAALLRCKLQLSAGLLSEETVPTQHHRKHWSAITLTLPQRMR
jgi:hypothetical protein